MVRCGAGRLVFLDEVDKVPLFFVDVFSAGVAVAAGVALSLDASGCGHCWMVSSIPRDFRRLFLGGSTNDK